MLSTPPAIMSWASPDLMARAAQAVDGAPWHLHRQACKQAGHACHVAVVFAGLVGTPKDDIVDARPIHRRVSAHERAQRDRSQIIGANAAECAAVATEWSANRVANISLGHGVPCSVA